MLEKLSGDAVEPDQLAWLHDIGLGQPLRPAQGPAGAEVEWWKLGSMVLGRACNFRASVLWYVVFFSMAVDDRGLNPDEESYSSDVTATPTKHTYVCVRYMSLGRLIGVKRPNLSQRID